MAIDGGDVVALDLLDLLAVLDPRLAVRGDLLLHGVDLHLVVSLEGGDLGVQVGDRRLAAREVLVEPLDLVLPAPQIAVLLGQGVDDGAVLPYAEPIGLGGQLVEARPLEAGDVAHELLVLLLEVPGHRLVALAGLGLDLLDEVGVPLIGPDVLRQAGLGLGPFLVGAGLTGVEDDGQYQEEHGGEHEYHQRDDNAGASFRSYGHGSCLRAILSRRENGTDGQCRAAAARSLKSSRLDGASQVHAGRKGMFVAPLGSVAGS